MRVPLRARLFAALTLLITCAGSAGGYAGFQLGAGAGMLVSMAVMVLGVRITVLLCRLQTQEFLQQIVGDGKAEASAEAVLRGTMLYEATVFPLLVHPAALLA
ncbi:hypothetical protein [Streptomyces fuscichromogenes]|nr:hypothetical protein [Streptomyces fuscichromogenes]